MKQDLNFIMSDLRSLSIIDLDENRFYRIFPKEKGFISAQIINPINDDQY